MIRRISNVNKYLSKYLHSSSIVCNDKTPFEALVNSLRSNKANLNEEKYGNLVYSYKKVKQRYEYLLIIDFEATVDRPGFHRSNPVQVNSKYL